MAGLDWVIIALYFAVVFGVAIWAYLQERGDESAAGYFLGGRNVGWFVVGASLFVSNIGSEHLVGLSGTGADSGVAVAQFEIIASLILLAPWAVASRAPARRTSSCPSTCAAACSRCPSSWNAATRRPRAST